jgi:hypothetical protein
MLWPRYNHQTPYYDNINHGCAVKINLAIR